MSEIFIDGDFSSGKGTCQYHCSPTCHPAQTGPEWVYGCTHKAWIPNREGDFVPIVECEGNPQKCELKEYKPARFYLRGLKARLKNAKTKALTLQNEIEEINILINKQ